MKIERQKITPRKKLNVMPIVHGTLKGDISKVCLTEKLWLLKRLNDEHLLNKKSEFIIKCRHKVSFQFSQLNILYFVFEKTEKRILEDCRKA